MHQTPRTASARSKRPETPQDKKLANAAIIGVSVLLVVGGGVVVVQDRVTQSTNAEAAETYTPAISPAEGGANADAVAFAVVGDSITEANSPNFIGGRVGAGSWVSHAQSNAARFAGGWADGGAQTAVMAKNFEPVTGAEVLVILAGTNDVLNDVPFDETAQNIKDISEASKAEHVVVSSIPPLNEDPDAAAQFNERLQDLAGSEGWEWVDGSAGLREGDQYGEDMSEDGVHPTPAGAEILGDAIQDAVVEVGVQSFQR